MNFQDILEVANDEAAAIELFEKLRWPNGPVCPHCGEKERIYRLTGVKGKTGTIRHGLKKCGSCRKQFTARVNTIFEDSHVPISKWLHCIYEMCGSKKGVSSAQLQRKLGVNYRTAWFMTHRIREAMKQEPLATKLGGGGGIVEVDETYIGGKFKNNRRKPYRGTGMVGKAIVMTLIERGGTARTFPIENTRQKTLQPMIRKHVEGTAHIITDQHGGYVGLDKKFASHSVIDHSKEYVRGIIHTNFSESYHSLVKRAIVGAFHHVSAKHLPRYLHEFEFRWNRRKQTDGDRFTDAVLGARGRRLTYKAPKKTEPTKS